MTTRLSPGAKLAKFCAPDPRRAPTIAAPPRSDAAQKADFCSKKLGPPGRAQKPRFAPLATCVFAALLLISAPAAAQVALAPYATLTPISDGNGATNDRSYAASEINATAFKNQSLVTVGNYQFTSYYGADETLIVGRRNLLTSPNVWTLLHTGFTTASAGAITDSHCVSTLGIDGDGFLHLAWGLHDDELQYTRSNASVLNDNSFTFPANLSAGASTVIPEEDELMTYPEFWNIPGSGDLLLTYRTGPSGNGEYQMSRWNNTTNAWSAVHVRVGSGNTQTGSQPWIDNDFSSTQNPPDANAYHNGLVYDSHGRLHVTWTWRTGSPNPGGPTDFQSNHNIMYAYSDNHGVDWRLANGTLLQRTDTSSITKHDIDENNATPAINLPFGSSLINQSSSAVGPDDTVYMASWWAPGAAQGNNLRQYMLAAYNPYVASPQWQTYQIGQRNTENGNNAVPESQLGAFRMSRPIVLTDDENRVFVVFSDYQRGQGVTVAYSEATTRNDWQFVELATGEDMELWEPKYDLNRWKNDGILSMYYQPAGGLAANTPSILEWDARTYFDVHPPLALEVNRTTGVVTVKNTLGQNVALSNYSITSAGGQLLPAAWHSLADQAVPGWGETQAAATGLAESSAAPLNLAASGQRQLGAPYISNAIAFGVDGPDDLAFHFTADGNAYSGAVTYVGPSRNNLALLVDPATGETLIKNLSPFEVRIDGYLIESDMNSLSPATWSSLSDQRAAGGDWRESAADAGALGELKPTSNLLIPPGAVWPIGDAYNAATGTPDLAFSFGRPTDFDFTPGIVLYMPLGPAGDFDQDQDVDGFDFLKWQQGFGALYDATDLADWRGSFGLASSVAAAQPAPEASSLILAAAASVMMIAGRGPRRR